MQGEHDFAIDVAVRDGRRVVAVLGEVDLATSARLGEEVEAALREGPVVLDLQGVTFLDSSGVRQLDRLMRVATEHGTELRVGEVLQPPVTQILELTGLLAVLPREGL